MSPILLVAAAAAALSLPMSTTAYTWSFATQPQQCQNVTVNVSGGTPPYRLLVVPFGPTPLSTNQEVRKIVDQPFNGNDNTLSVNLKYPANSQFVAVLSDATGFGSGGTTVATQVQSSDDTSCFDANKSVSPLFIFALQPTNQVVQCTPTRIWWNQGQPQGDTTFLGVIPGGKSFAVPKGPLTPIEGQGEGFTWTPSVRAGTTLLLVAGDSRGNGTAGSALNTVSSNTQGDISNCLNQDSPSSTPGTPAGAVATATSSGGSGGQQPSSGGDPNSGSKSNTGAIVGGVVGGIIAIVALLLIAWFFMRRRKHDRQQKERPVDLLHSDEGDETNNQRAQLPQYYEPEPFIVPEPSEGGHTSNDPRSSNAFSTSRSGTPDLLHGGYTPSSTSGPRKTPMKQLRPVNIIQHDDAGPSEPAGPADGEDTIELPPAYTNLKSKGSAPGTPTTEHSTPGVPPAAGPSSSA